jgi:hypothetical protein
MTDYKNIRGKKIKFFTSDLDNAQGEGQIFYSDTDSEYKVAIASGAWSAGSNLNTNRKNGSGFGPSTAAAFAGGQVTTPSQNLTEEYNGSGWSTSGNLNTARTQLAGTTAGSQTAGLVFGGNVPPGSAPHANESNATEEYDGTSWTSGNNMATTVTNHGGSGTQTAAFSAGGNEGGTPKNNSQEYDGTNWSNGNNINTARQTLAGMGTQTAGLVVGGEVSPPSSSPGATEEYDGTNWTAGTATNTGRHSSSGGGIQTAAIVFAGTTVSPDAVRDETELYDGTSWTEVADLATARTTVGGYNGPSSSGICIAGGAPSLTGATEEWNFSAATITAAAWSSGEALNQIRRVGAGTGTQTSGMIFGGLDTSTALGHTEQYDGTDWTEVGDLNTARGKLGSATAGSQTAALGFGGSTSEPSNPAIVNNSEEFNGTSWAEGDNLNTARYVIAGAGTQTAGLGFGGYTTSTNRDESEEYNGTSWSEGDNLNTARGYLAGCGTQTAGLAIQGFQDGGEGEVSKVEEYNGTSWTEVTNAPFTSRKNCAAGIQTNAITFAGHNNRTDVVGYDGTTWSTRPSMATGRDFASGFGTATAAVCAGGDGGTPGDEGVNTVEEFTGDTPALNLKTITDS